MILLRRCEFFEGNVADGYRLACTAGQSIGNLFAAKMFKVCPFKEGSGNGWDVAKTDNRYVAH